MFDIVFAQVIGTKSANFDVISLFGHDKYGFKECHRALVDSVRWHPFGRQNNDKAMTFGHYLTLEGNVLICSVVHFCVKIRNSGNTYQVNYDVTSTLNHHLYLSSTAYAKR